MKEKIYCGLDIGSQNIKAGLLRVKNFREIELIGAALTPTRGYQKGSINDLAEFTECLEATFEELSQRTGYKIKETTVGVNADLIDVRDSQAAIPLLEGGSKVIAERDVEKVNKQARLLGINIEQAPLHDLPQNYIIDDVSFSVNPLGLYGRKLAVCSLLIAASSDKIRNITKAIHQAGYEAVDFYFSSYMAAQMCLEENCRSRGCALIDIGSEVTSLLIFKDKILRYVRRIDMGADQLTEKIAEELDFSFQLAEDIKKSYAAVVGFDANSEEEILIKRGDMYVPLKRRRVDEAMEPQIQKLIVKIKEALKESEFLSKIEQGIFMIGGGSLLSGLLERLSQELKLPVNMGQLKIPSKKSLENAAVFSSAFGLALSAFSQSSDYLSEKTQPQGVRRMITRLVDVYQQYF